MSCLLHLVVDLMCYCNLDL